MDSALWRGTSLSTRKIYLTGTFVTMSGTLYMVKGEAVHVSNNVMYGRVEVKLYSFVTSALDG
jgi:hypothetical protein